MKKIGTPLSKEGKTKKIFTKIRGPKELYRLNNEHSNINNASASKIFGNSKSNSWFENDDFMVLSKKIHAKNRINGLTKIPSKASSDSESEKDEEFIEKTKRNAEALLKETANQYLIEVYKNAKKKNQEIAEEKLKEEMAKQEKYKRYTKDYLNSLYSKVIKGYHAKKKLIKTNSSEQDSSFMENSKLSIDPKSKRSIKKEEKKHDESSSEDKDIEQLINNTLQLVLKMYIEINPLDDESDLLALLEKIKKNLVNNLLLTF